MPPSDTPDASPTEHPVTTSTHSDAPNPAASTNWWDYCPNCSARLENHSCKYRCPRCHYFMSCSDFD